MRVDHDLGFLLKFENVAWYEKGMVKILDRRIYPTRIEFVTCSKHEEVAKAIADMVTQSAGPYLAAGMGMALAAFECRNMKKEEAKTFLAKASYTLSHARPTTVARMSAITEKCLTVACKTLDAGGAVDEAIFVHTVAEQEKKYERFVGIGRTLVSLFPDTGTVLTQCFGETIVGMMLRASREMNKDLKVICMETRPFFQGARLTASVACEMGFDVTVITDNMAAYAMKNKMIDVFTSAADAISCDGYVVNKVGTYQLALLCKYFGIPYFVTGTPDKKHETITSVKIEMRDPEAVLEAMGVRTAMEGVKGWYPAFDTTPPTLVDAIVTDKGAFSPFALKDYFKEG